MKKLFGKEKALERAKASVRDKESEKNELERNKASKREGMRRGVQEEEEQDGIVGESEERDVGEEQEQSPDEKKPLIRWQNFAYRWRMILDRARSCKGMF